MQELSQDPSPCDEDIVVIGGFGRTGTTLMQGLICQSPDVMPVTPECFVFTAILDVYQLGMKWWSGSTSKLFVEHSDYLRLSREMLSLYLVHLRERFGPEKRLVQKDSTALAMLVPQAAQLLPRAKFVVTVRDPRDALASHLTPSRKGGWPFTQDRVDQYAGLYAGLAAHRQAMAGRTAIVRYEHLVMDADAVMQQVASFLGIRLPANIGAMPWTHDRPSVASKSPLDGLPVSSTRIGAFRSVLPAEIVANLERKRTSIEQQIGFPVFFDVGRNLDPVIFL